MKAIILERLMQVSASSEPLRMVEIPRPVPGKGEILVRVEVCGVCHTELDEIEGRTPPPRLPVVLGHQVVGRVAELGPGVDDWSPKDRVGVAWVYHACGVCDYCTSGRENLCPQFLATGRDRDGGYAEFMVAPASFIYHLPAALTSKQAAPLLCAGAIGYRSLQLTNLRPGQPLGLTGFGASAHLVLKMARQLLPGSEIFVFARSERERTFARELGADWAGDTTDRAPRPLAAIIDTTPAWTPIVEALANLAAGGRLVINAIRKEAADQGALTKLDYSAHLWLEKEIKSVANVTRLDVARFLELAAQSGLMAEVQEYPLQAANQALVDLKTKPVRGAKVLLIDPR
jgi:propanol-preferring alcohol dehydrogenase